MKLSVYVFISCSLLFATSSCSHGKSTSSSVETTIDTVLVGTEGGFTGASDLIMITRQCQVSEYNVSLDRYEYTHKLDQEKCSDLFEQVDALDPFSITYSIPGNFNSILVFIKGGKEHKLVWSNSSESNPGGEIGTFFQNALMLAKGH
jgi:hypothetical protein